ncbi:hypothetical protein CAPTEDRAFT_183515 [Capitella teleta]|uniref:phosphatidylinositol 3-kinase n=1 Tax=Capitella teleta TaxID=283909 RepID=R7U2Z9_CAPTE|nr:hypothetical protein CAPTEDRAFT_183515 [Capitella teleta]|eukprot:ELT97555.1 hypothetical protein CAPTEDRAFT_183515 [Capitella teleta]
MSAELYVFLWEKRHYLYACPLALPRVLAACPCWSYATLRETYTMVQQWVPVDPVFALELLLPQYADTYVRNCAVERIKELPTDSMYDYLPQIIQALKYECYHTSALAKMLLERSVTNARFAHQMYWLLKEAADDYRYRKRYQLLFGALLSVVGESMRTEFVKEEDFIKMTSAIADKVKAAKEKENVLQKELENMWDFLSHSSVRLPLNAACEVSGVDVKSCSYYTSFTFPLKLVMKNIDVRAEPIYSMFKVGDDLRQDMLTMQLVRIMDRLWLQDNLDLKIITFGCQPTGNRKGLVEIVTESDTLRKIQVKHGHGVTGSFKDKPISDWLQQQNPTELDYEKAVDNFSSSCAGYCVATYVLGIGDRHNDNIMIKQSGHLFHIDFSKFLGDSQMFGNFKRDRVPFVLTSDMAYVINGGDRQSSHFQSFVDQCCRAFNILRKHRILLVNLFSLMTLSGIPGVTSDAARYVHKALLPESTDAEATAMFTRMIYKSLESTFTQVNFFIHNLAQMKFSGHQEGALLSFIPKTFSLQTDGKISKVEVFGFQKRYNPEKYYIFIIKVVREGQQVPSFVFRRYSEFQELHQKLVVTFPLVKLPSFTGKVLLGRTHVRSVAETRKQELDAFLKQLLLLASEIAEHDLIYTFFHPMLRDEQEIDKTNLQKLKEGSQSRPHTNPLNFEGKVKLSLTYKTNALTVMIMHVKDLSLLPSGDPPDPYVKLYLMPDAMKVTKRKTKIAKATLHPTYNEMLMYRMSWEELKNRTLQVSVWSYDGLKENEFMGAAHIVLSDLNLSQEVVGWYPLLTLHKLSLHSAGPL